MSLVNAAITLAKKTLFDGIALKDIVEEKTLPITSQDKIQSVPLDLSGILYQKKDGKSVV